MVIAARQEARAGGRTERRGVPLAVGQAVVSQLLHRRHIDSSPVRRPGRNPGVVVQDDQGIGRIRWCWLLAKGRPVGDRVADIEIDEPVEPLGHDQLLVTVG